MRSKYLWVCLVMAMSSSIQSLHGQQDADHDGPTALQFIVKSIDGEDIDLRQYHGKAIVVVNVASQCGYTPQYAPLQALYEEFKDQGLVILGFPCNQFRARSQNPTPTSKSFALLNIK
jgi:glutathione peroxidase